MTGLRAISARVELLERLADRRHEDLRVGQRRDRHPLAQVLREFHGWT